MVGSMKHINWMVSTVTVDKVWKEVFSKNYWSRHLFQMKYSERTAIYNAMIRCICRSE